ncbi:MAG: hypothetical protein H7A51_01145 [Akkermansiaceae bacterium]|nr:hypothetical protein [Akkermansiaceae bacterium]
MKKALIFFVVILLGGSWTANKFLQRANKSSEEKDRFIEQASNYGHDAQIFLGQMAEQHHDKAFAASYRMWKLSPVSEIDLATHYDEQVYYRTLQDIISEEAKQQGQADAYRALLDIGRFYGVPQEGKIPGSGDEAATHQPVGTQPAPQAGNSGKKESLLKKSKLGEKRVIPGSRRRDDDR